MRKTRAVVLALLALLAVGCDDDNPIGPTPIVGATPSPSPSADPRCVVAFVTIAGDEAIAGLGENQPRTITATAYNAANTSIDASCTIARRAGWLVVAGPVRLLGDTGSFQLRYYATAAGEAIFTVTIGNVTSAPFKVAIRE